MPSTKAKSSTPTPKPPQIHFKVERPGPRFEVFQADENPPPLQGGMEFCFDPIQPDVPGPFCGTSIKDLLNMPVTGPFFANGNRPMYSSGGERFTASRVIIRMTDPFGFSKEVELNLRPHVNKLVPNSKKQLGTLVALSYYKFWEEMGHSEQWLEHVYLFQVRQLVDETWEAVVGASPALWRALHTGSLWEEPCVHWQSSEYQLEYPSA